MLGKENRNTAVTETRLHEGGNFGIVLKRSIGSREDVLIPRRELYSSNSASGPQTQDKHEDNAETEEQDAPKKEAPSKPKTPVLALLGSIGYGALVAASHLVPATPRILFGALVANLAASQYLGIPIVIATGVTAPASLFVLGVTVAGALLGFMWYWNGFYARKNS